MAGEAMLPKECHEETLFSLSGDAPNPPERRRAPRHLSILRVGVLVGPEGRELCLIRNISGGGLMAHVYSRRANGDAVSVELKTNQQIPGEVVWVEGANVGIRFNEPIDVAEMLSNQSSLDNGWRPRLPRIEVDRLATVRCGARIYGVNTRDISQGGVKVETDEPLEAGAEVVLTLDRFRPLHGVVRWAEEDLAGIAFNQVVPFRELMGWLRGDAS
ncbi:MAG: PilZ domain-containing protein [Allosphingosinicella sp.]